MKFNLKLQNKEKLPKVSPQIKDLISIVDYTYISSIDNDVFLTKTRGCIDLLKIPCKDLNAIQDYDLEFDIWQFAKLYKAFNGDLKIITMNYPVDTYQQISFIDSTMERTANPVYLEELDNEKRSLMTAHEGYNEREFYLMVFANSKEEYIKRYNTIFTYLKKNGAIAKLELSKKLQILYKLNNLNVNLAMNRINYVPAGIPEKMDYNPYLLSTIQPQGNMSFSDERITKKGDGYEACIHIYDFKDRVQFNWLSNIALFSNTVATIDISSADRTTTIRNINKSMEEQASRYLQSRYATEKIDAQKIHSQLDHVYDEMTSMGEVIKNITLRIYVYDKTQAGLEQKLAEILSEIESQGYKGTVFLDGNEFEWRSLYLSATQQKAFLQNRIGKSMTSEAFAIGHPYHFSSLLDPYGLYTGYTKTGGIVAFDKFQKDKQRLSHCGWVFGNMGAGKSTFLKKELKKDAILGNYIRGFATNHEFDGIIKRVGGEKINLDGSQGFLNVLQVYRTSQNEASSFIKHISKIGTFYKFLCPEANTYDIAELSGLLKKLYQQHMHYDETSDKKITGLPAHMYPIWSDFLDLLRKELKETASSKNSNYDIHTQRLKNMELIISNMIDVYGKIFNGHSSIREFADEQIVFFSVENLKSFGENIFDAQMFSAMSLLWDNLIHVGLSGKILYDEQKNFFEKEAIKPQIKKYMIYMDEAHHFVNARKLTAVNYLLDYQRESRKYWGGILFATQSVKDTFPEGSTAEGIDAIKKLFALSQYKFVFKQGSDSKETLEMAFREELPENDLNDIPKFEQGECVLLTGAESIRFFVEVSPSELQLFTGGA